MNNEEKKTVRTFKTKKKIEKKNLFIEFGHKEKSSPWNLKPFVYFKPYNPSNIKNFNSSTLDFYLFFFFNFRLYARFFLIVQFQKIMNVSSINYNPQNNYFKIKPWEYLIKMNEKNLNEILKFYYWDNLWYTFI